MVGRETAAVRDRVLNDLTQRRASLWISKTSLSAEIEGLLTLDWVNIWNFTRGTDVAGIWEKQHPDRSVIMVSAPDEDIDSFDTSTFVRLYDLKSKQRLGTTIRDFFEDQLRGAVKNVGGSLVICGVPPEKDLVLIDQLAPQLQVILLEDNLDEPSLPSRFLRWSDISKTPLVDVAAIHETEASPTTIDLLDVKGLNIPNEVLRRIFPSWLLLTSDKTRSPHDIEQKDFDDFLAGDPQWSLYAAQGAWIRPIQKNAQKESDRTLVEPDKLILETLKNFDRQPTDPRDALRQLVIFAESGSGITTLFRQLSVIVAQAGYLTFLSRPMPARLDASSLNYAILELQDRWREALRESRDIGAKQDRLPACIFIDKDGDSAEGQKGFLTALSALGREILVVRAEERTRSDISEARAGYSLTAEISRADVLTLGHHLRNLSERYNLEPIPSSGEWSEFHRGLLDVVSHVAGPEEYETVPHLFLIGIYPFIRERVRDRLTLEQYYFSKWEHTSKDVRKMIHLVSAAGAFGIGVPYDILRRDADIEIALLEGPSIYDRHRIDEFIEWRKEGAFASNWHVRARHPIVAQMLCAAIDPIDGMVPMKPLESVLKALTQKAEDIWFAETLAFKIGRQFKANARSFSLETDTAAQRSARRLFSSLPKPVSSSSRVIMHHEARFHVHVIHACLEALSDTSRTTLDADTVGTLLAAEIGAAEDLLENALSMDSSGERESNVLNTFAALRFSLSEGIRNRNAPKAETYFQEGLDLQERAIEKDVTNGTALFQFISRAQEQIGRNPQEDFRFNLFERAEARLMELRFLQHEGRWRNVDPLDAELQIGTLAQKQIEIAKTLDQETAASDGVSDTARLFIELRLLLGDSSESQAFSDSMKTQKIREVRTHLLGIVPHSARSLLFLYRLFLIDPIGRFDFKERLNLLSRLKQISTQDFRPFTHDEAALLCQMDRIDEGADKFREFRAYRFANQDKWFWLNEKLLVKKDKETGTFVPREFVMRVTDGEAGWAVIENTRIRMKYQSRQFPGLALHRNDRFRAYLRFTLYGLQAVPEALANRDIRRSEE